MSAFLKVGKLDCAINLFEEMASRGIELDVFSFSILNRWNVKRREGTKKS